MVNGSEIARRMHNLGITQNQLADIVAVSHAMMCYIIQGKREPRLATIKLISDTLGCKVDDLLMHY